MRPHTLLIGGTRGIGRVVAERLSARDHTLSIIARSEPDDPVGGARHFTADAGDEAGLRSTLTAVAGELGPLRNVVLVQRYRGDGDTWQGELAVTLTAAKTAIEHFAEHLDEAEDHAVVLVTSNASRLVADDQPVGYHAAKAALVQMARYYAVTLGPRRIRVNCVSPGAVLKDEAREHYEAKPSLVAMYRDITPLGRMTSPEDVARAVEFLCDGTSFITGQDLVVDGGLSLMWQDSLARRLTGE